MSKTKKVEATVTVNRRKESRRSGTERRLVSAPVAVERRQGERREKVARRRQIDPTTCERDYNDLEIEFMHALDLYKRRNGRMFPTCSEVLEVLMSLGYRKVAPATIDDATASAAATSETPSPETLN